jgi:PBSX family phage terminase large subunit
VTAALDLPLSPTQVCSIREATGRVNVYEGAIRSGKTIASLLRWLIFVAAAPHTGALVIVGRTRDSAWRNVIGPLQDPALFGPVAGQTVGNYGAPTVTILGRRVYVLGAHDAKAEAVLRGLTVAGAYVDEATVVPEQFFTQLLGRMSVPGAQLFATTNPDNPAHWLKARFLDRLLQLPDWRRFHFTLADNPSLTAAYVESIKREFTGLWYRRFILGEWVAAEGAIYSMWNPDAHVVPWAELPEMQRLLAVGVDYGTTNATAALLLGLGVDARLYLVDEWRHDPKQTNVRLTDTELARRVGGWLDNPHVPLAPGREQPRIEWVAVDPSAASFKVQLHQDGVMGLVDADNDVAYGIRTSRPASPPAGSRCPPAAPGSSPKHPATAGTRRRRRKARTSRSRWRTTRSTPAGTRSRRRRLSGGAASTPSWRPRDPDTHPGRARQARNGAPRVRRPQRRHARRRDPPLRGPGLPRHQHGPRLGPGPPRAGARRGRRDRRRRTGVAHHARRPRRSLPVRREGRRRLMPLPNSGIAWPPADLDRVSDSMEVWSAWFGGDPEELDRAYWRYRRHRSLRPQDRPSQYRGGVVGMVARTFWGAPRGDLRIPKAKLHVPFAGDICQASADLLFADPPTIQVEDKKTNDRLDELTGDGMLSTFAEAAELGAALGGTYLRVAWDKDVNPAGPFLTAVDADGAWPEFCWGRLQAVTFWFDVTPADQRTTDTRLRHLERHELDGQGNGVVLHGLYQGTQDNLGRPVPLTEAASLADLAEDVTDGNVISTESPGLAVVYVPNQRPQRRWRHDPIGRSLGRSDLDGIEGLMDAIDETYTSWMRDIRLGKARVFVAQSLLENLGTGRGATFDADQEIYAPLNALQTQSAGGQNGLPIQAEQFEIRYAEHQATITQLMSDALRTAGYSSQTFGMVDGSSRGQATATEIEAKQQRSFMTRDRKIRLWRPAIADAVAKLLAVDKAIFNSQVTVDDPTVGFPDGVQDTMLTLAQTAQALATAKAASTKTIVEMVHPDWDNDQVKAEVDLIQTEDAAAAPLPDPAGAFGAGNLGA